MHHHKEYGTQSNYSLIKHKFTYAGVIVSTKKN